jgi:sensor domain CHASE-containing protein
MYLISLPMLIFWLIVCPLMSWMNEPSKQEKAKYKQIKENIKQLDQQIEQSRLDRIYLLKDWSPEDKINNPGRYWHFMSQY